MTSEEMIAAYESILQVTTQMLEAARAADWDRLVASEKQCRALVERLAAARQLSTPALEPHLRSRKVQIIRRVLADDAEIRNLTEPWMHRLQHMLASVGRERRLQAAYGSQAAD